MIENVPSKETASVCMRKEINVFVDRTVTAVTVGDAHHGIILFASTKIEPARILEIGEEWQTVKNGQCTNHKSMNTYSRRTCCGLSTGVNNIRTN